MTPQTDTPASPRERLQEVQARIAAARAGAIAPAGEVTLIAVSKTHSAERIEELITAGQKHFGENRVQEAKAKWPGLRERHSGLTLHLIGPLQSNKTREALALFDVIHSLDREKLALSLQAEWKANPKPLELFVQVNIGEEAQKSGVRPREAGDFVRFARDELKLPVTGLMCIPPVDASPAPFFALTRNIARECGISRLSMGMSGDFETAIRFGATHIRVGTALFGERAANPNHE